MTAIKLLIGWLELLSSDYTYTHEDFDIVVRGNGKEKAYDLRSLPTIKLMKQIALDFDFYNEDKFNAVASGVVVVMESRIKTQIVGTGF